MHWSGFRKRFQKRSFDLLSQRYGLLVLLLSLVVVTVAVIHFGETLLHWSTEKYAAVFNSFSDNIVGRSFRERLCLPVPIDIVYTWVNGSDPQLLEDLRIYRRALASELRGTDGPNSTTSANLKCDFDSCVPADAVVIEPALPVEISLAHFAVLYSVFSPAKAVMPVTELLTGHNLSIVFFDQPSDAEAATLSTVVVHNKPATIRRLYYTADKTLPNAVASSDVVLMTGFPDISSKESLLEAMPSEYRRHISKTLLYSDRGIAALTVTDENTLSSLLTSKNITIAGKSPTFSTAMLVWDLTDYRKDDDIAASRFADNDELRYSLRSVERHAPWVRHVYVVTNGQIPSWLNLDYGRVSVVTHAEIFPNASHLPTFSSPAIESHLHRIPGLSERFIYMNDDVMFGRDVWPDDFVSASGAQKVYLTYPVPNCREGCPASWIADGYCDRACNNSQCEWDGGDCESGRSQAQYPFYGGAGGTAHQSGSSTRQSDLYCNSGCANNWIADRYCDQACNVRSCAFDAGDCGTGDFHFLNRFDLTASSNEDVLDARGYDMFYFNLTSLLGGKDGQIVSGSTVKDDVVRSASIARKFHVSTVLLHGNRSARSLHFSFAVKNNEQVDVTVNVTVLVDTKFVINRTHVDSDVTTEKSAGERDQTDEDLLFVANFTHVSKKFPKPKHEGVEQISEAQQSDTVVGDFELPEELQNEYEGLLEQVKLAELTQQGFDLLSSSIWTRYLNQLKLEGKKPVLRFKSTRESEPVSSTTIRIVDVDGVRSPGVRSPGNSLKAYLNTTRTRGRVSRRSELVNRTYDGSEVVRAGRKLQSFDDDQSLLLDADKHLGFLPWEKESVGTFAEIDDSLAKLSRVRQYSTDSKSTGRRLLDTYADSLRHVSRVYNRAYGYVARRVPAHMPHMVDRRIMAELQAKFPGEWDETSSHRIRQANDMQFAFAYFYYLISEPLNATLDDVFREIDVDRSGVLSDRELRILATRIYDLPLDLKTLEEFEQILVNCSAVNTTPDAVAELNTVSTYRAPAPRSEVYYEKRLPQVTRALIASCDPIAKLIKDRLKTRLKYEHEVVSEDEIYFKMLTANVSRVVSTLDEVRRQMRKFICLNDNIDYQIESAKVVKVVMRDFYETFMPDPSRFELPRQYRNKFLHVNELHQWWYLRKWLRSAAQGVLLAAVVFALGSFFFDRVTAFRRRMFRR